MATFERIILKAKGETEYDGQCRHNYYSANLFHFEQGILNKELSPTDKIKVYLMPNGLATATLPDGRRMTYG